MMMLDGIENRSRQEKSTVVVLKSGTHSVREGGKRYRYRAGDKVKVPASIAEEWIRAGRAEVPQPKRRVSAPAKESEVENNTESATG